MKAGKRTDRIGHLMQMELSRLVLTRLKDPRLGFVTITHVDVTPDLRSACVYYSVMGDETVKRDTQTALERSAGFLQKEIASVIKIRNTPRLAFKLDQSLDRGMEIDGILRKIKTNDPQPPEDAVDTGENP